MRLKNVLRNVIWPRRGLGGWAGWLALQPASMIFRTGVVLRNAAYETGIFRIEDPEIPVVSVGNIAVGGTGKTPITLWLAQRLAADGSRIAIVLRGYGGSGTGVTVVSDGSGPLVDAGIGGDEAVMLARNFRGIVITAPKRIEGARRARELGCKLVILDDGFQHRALKRDFDFVLLDGRDGSLLPSGPMRETRSALRRAHAIALVSKQPGTARPLGSISSAAGKPLFVVRFHPVGLVESCGGHWHERPLRELSGRHIAAIAGIADPQPFYATLRHWEARIGEVFEFPDHHRYTSDDWRRLSRATHEFDLLVTTEKDLVKLETFPFARGKLLALRVTPEIDHADQLIAQIREHTTGRIGEVALKEGPHAD